MIAEFLQGTANEILFVPYAGVDVGGKVYPESYDSYTARVRGVFETNPFVAATTEHMKRKDALGKLWIDRLNALAGL